MPKITKKEVLRIAALAKVAITDVEAEQFTKELDAILGYVRQLEAVDTTGLEPTYQVNGLVNVKRPDKIIDYHVTQKALLQNARAQKDDQLEVPRVL